MDWQQISAWLVVVAAVGWVIRGWVLRYQGKGGGGCGCGDCGKGKLRGGPP